MKAAIWGAGLIACDFLNKKVLYEDYDIVCIVDNNPALSGKDLGEYPILQPTELYGIKVDVIIICSKYIDQIKKQILEDGNVEIEPENILSYKQVEDRLSKKICEIYKDSEDPEIRKICADYESKCFNEYGSYWPERGNRYDVLRDSDNWPYIMFENKKMYYPVNWDFRSDQRGEYVEDVLLEQQSGSPHLYIREEEQIRPDSVIVDAGVCEGNFALRYVEKAKKVYLIESDDGWFSALKRTFEPFGEKVALKHAFLSDSDSDQTTTLDSLVEENIDFLKMDIEGAEIDALKGAAAVLKRSNAKCAICSYHRYNDEQRIREILDNYGYSTSTSEGYMFFAYDDSISETMDFRRGIVYGEKDHI